MAAPIIPDLLDMFADEVTVETAPALDAYGAPIGSYGAPVKRKAYVIGRTRIVRAPDGQERISTVQATLAGAFDVTVLDRYTLPTRFVPNQPKAISVELQSDENGHHHTKVYFQ